MIKLDFFDFRGGEIVFFTCQLLFVKMNINIKSAILESTIPENIECFLFDFESPLDASPRLVSKGHKSSSDEAVRQKRKNGLCRTS